jgi:hypothetical protein
MKNKNKMFSSICFSAFEDFVEKNIAVFYSTPMMNNGRTTQYVK